MGLLQEILQNVYSALFKLFQGQIMSLFLVLIYVFVIINYPLEEVEIILSSCGATA